MHGKIVMHMESTGCGTVMNLAKVFYDFNVIKILAVLCLDLF